MAKRTPAKINQRAALELWKQIVKRPQVCAHCGGSGPFDAHHIIKKSQSSWLSVEPRNGLCFCKSCHFGWWHYDEKRGLRWLDSEFPGLFDWLDANRRVGVKVNWAERRAELILLWDEIESAA